MREKLTNIINFLVKTFTSKAAKRFYWQFFVGLIGLLIAAIAELNVAQGALIVAILQGITKEINNRYLSN